jgi:hypothetical protein
MAKTRAEHNPHKMEMLNGIINASSHTNDGEYTISYNFNDQVPTDSQFFVTVIASRAYNYGNSAVRYAISSDR